MRNAQTRNSVYITFVINLQDIAPKIFLDVRAPVQVDSQQGLLDGVKVSNQLKQINAKLDANIVSHQNVMQIVQHLSQVIVGMNERMENMERLLDLLLENQQVILQLHMELLLYDG